VTRKETVCFCFKCFLFLLFELSPNCCGCNFAYEISKQPMCMYLFGIEQQKGLVFQSFWRDADMGLYEIGD
jgi:hypothetical protein